MHLEGRRFETAPDQLPTCGTLAVMRSGQLNPIVPDRAVWSPLYTIADTLNKALPEMFAPDYTDLADAARRRLHEVMGDDGPPEPEP
jgi:hypothetical protein